MGLDDHAILQEEALDLFAKLFRSLKYVLFPLTTALRHATPHLAVGNEDSPDLFLFLSRYPASPGMVQSSPTQIAGAFVRDLIHEAGQG